MEVIEQKKRPYLKWFAWFFQMIGYTLVLITATILFPKVLYIDSSYYGIWGFLASILIYVLNKTIKPILFLLTLPIIGLTLGIFYPFLNVIILKIVSFVLGEHFQITGIFFTFFVAIFLSIMNVLMDHLVVDPITKGEKNESRFY